MAERASGRAMPVRSRRDLLLRGILAHIDRSHARRSFGWRPVADPEVFTPSAPAIRDR